MIGDVQSRGRRSQAQKREQRVVPRQQHAVAIEYAHALRHRVERCLEHDGAFGEFAGTLAGVLRLDIGDVGVDADDAALAGPPLVDLDPAPVGQRDDMAAIRDLVQRDPLRDPAIGRDHRPQHAAGRSDLAEDLVEPNAGDYLVGELGPEREIGLVAQHEAIIRVEDRKALVDALDRVAEAPSGAFSRLFRLRQFGVGRGEFTERAFEIGGAFADLALERDRGFEHGEGVAAQVGRAFHPAHEGRVDPRELAQLALERGDAVVLDRGHRPIASPLKVWLTCNA